MVFLQRENKPEEESLRYLNNINKSDVKILSINWHWVKYTYIIFDLTSADAQEVLPDIRILHDASVQRR